MANTVLKNVTAGKAYIITGPTSGIGRSTALMLAKYGTVVLVGRNRQKLDELQKTIENMGGEAVSVLCDVADINSVRRAAQQIIALGLPIAGLLNNAGAMPQTPLKSPQGWDLAFATNHLGPFALTEALAPHLADGTNVVFIVSAIEDPDRKPVKFLGMRGGRYISVEASARGEWQQPGSRMPGADAYSTSKQACLAATMVLARENPRLHINAIEPGITPGTGLGGRANAIANFIFGLITHFPPFARYRSTPERSAAVITKILTDELGKTGVYYDEKGEPMRGSVQVSDPKFQERVVAETRAFLARAAL